VFIDPNNLSAFSETDCMIENTAGTDFILLNGDIIGTQIELIQSTLISQKWRYKTWPDDHFFNSNPSIWRQ